MRSKPAAICGKLSSADWPGPPARKNTGSGAGSAVFAGTRPMRSSITRPFGAAGFSGTFRLAHCAPKTSAMAGFFRSQSLNVSSPMVRLASAVADAQATAMAIAMATKRGLIIILLRMGRILGESVDDCRVTPVRPGDVVSSPRFALVLDDAPIRPPATAVFHRCDGVGPGAGHDSRLLQPR